MFWVRVLKINDLRPPLSLHDGAVMIRDGLRDLGYTAYFDDERPTAGRAPSERQVIIGGQCGTPKTLSGIPEGSIVYQLEQTGCAHHFTPAYLRLLRRCVVWDYNPYNVIALAKANVHAIFVPFSYVQALTPPEPQAPIEPDFDVLFMGAINPPRAKILNGLEGRGFKVYKGYSCWGSARDEILRRSRLVLNVHFYQANKILESCRLGVAMAACRPVLSQYDADVRPDPFFAPGMARATYDRLVETAARLLNDPVELERLATVGFELFRSRTAASVIEQALGAQAA